MATFLISPLAMNDLAFVVAALLAASAVLAMLALHGHNAGTRSRFEARTLADLQRLARSQGLTGLSRLRKAELIDRLLSAEVPG